MDGTKAAADGLTMPALMAAVGVAMLTILSSAGDVAAAQAPVVWSGLVFGQILDAALSLAAFFMLVRWSRRWPIGRVAWSKPLMLHLLIVVAMALACMTIFIAAVEIAAGTGFENARETNANLGDELVRMFLLACMAQLVVRLRDREDPVPAEPALASGHVLVRDEGRHHVQPIREVRWADAQGNYVRLHTLSGRQLLRATMADMERRLGAAFVRVHRSTIVNLEAVRQFGRDDRGRLRVRLDDGTDLPVGRNYAGRLRAVLDEDRSSPPA